MNPTLVIFITYILPIFAGLIGLFVPGYGGQRAWREARNKARVMAVVNDVSASLPPATLDKPLSQLLPLCYQNGALPALFSIEGLGLLYTRRFYEHNLPRQNILTDPKLASIPANSLTMLHAGMGLSFASRTLAGLKKESTPAEITSRLTTFLDICQHSSRPGYTGCALEMLGIPVVILHGLALTQRVGQQLEGMNAAAAAYLWRGVGRALYFYPPHFIPRYNNPWPGFDAAARLAPTELARKNMIAGLAWACTLVNIRHPEIMAALISHRQAHDADLDALVNGVTSAIMMYHDTAPDDVHLQNFIHHQPIGNSAQAKLWAEMIQQPCEQALQEIYPLLKQKQMLEELFRYQSLFALRDK